MVSANSSGWLTMRAPPQARQIVDGPSPPLTEPQSRQRLGRDAVTSLLSGGEM